MTDHLDPPSGSTADSAPLTGGAPPAGGAPVTDSAPLTVGPFVQLQMAISEGGQGRVVVATTDLTHVHILVIDPREGGTALQVSTLGTLLDDVLAHLPLPSGQPTLHPSETVDIPQEYSVALAHALKTGDTTTSEAIREDVGWTHIPPLVSTLAHDVVGSVQLALRSSAGGAWTVGSLLLIPTGWVELQPVDHDLIRHIPLTVDDVRARLVSSLAAAMDEVLAAPTSGPPEQDPHAQEQAS